MRIPTAIDRTGRGHALAALVLAAAPLAAAGCVATAIPAREWPRMAARADRPAATASDAIFEVPVERRPWRYGHHEGWVVETPHYRVYTTVSRRSIVDGLPLFLERALAHFRSDLGTLPAPRERLETYLFDTRNEWEAKTRQLLSDRASTYLTIERGGFTTRGTSVLYYIGRSDTLAIAAHEGWHQYAQRVFRNQLPLWLEEGIATYMEGYFSHPDGVPKFRAWANVERYQMLRSAVRADRLIPLSELLERPPQSFLEDGKNRLLIYYSQVWALVHFLAEGDGGRYRPALQQVLADAVQGRLAGRRRGGGRRLGPRVLVEYFESDVDTFERRYLAFVLQVVKTGGRDRIVQGRSPVGSERD